MNDPRLERYLLGDLSEEEQDALERDFFRSDETFDLLQAAEDDLVDAYVAGTLPPEAAAKLQERLARSPVRRARVEFARTLRKTTRRAARPALRANTAWVSLAAGLAVGFAGSLLMLRTVQHDLRVARDERALESRRADQLAEELELARQASGTASQALSPGSERDAKPRPPLTLGANVDWIRLQLRLPRDAGRGPFTASLETPEGSVIATIHGLRPRSGAVDVVWPRLDTGTYIVTLRTAEPVESYSFSVRSVR